MNSTTTQAYRYDVLERSIMFVLEMVIFENRFHRFECVLGHEMMFECVYEIQRKHLYIYIWTSLNICFHTLETNRSFVPADTVPAVWEAFGAFAARIRQWIKSKRGHFEQMQTKMDKFGFAIRKDAWKKRGKASASELPMHVQTLWKRVLEACKGNGNHRSLTTPWRN